MMWVKLFSSQFKVSTVGLKGTCTRVLRAGMFLAQDDPFRDACLRSW